MNALYYAVRRNTQRDERDLAKVDDLKADIPQALSLLRAS